MSSTFIKTLVANHEQTLQIATKEIALKDKLINQMQLKINDYRQKLKSVKQMNKFNEEALNMDLVSRSSMHSHIPMDLSEPIQPTTSSTRPKEAPVTSKVPGTATAPIDENVSQKKHKELKYLDELIEVKQQQLKA